MSYATNINKWFIFHSKIDETLLEKELVDFPVIPREGESLNAKKFLPKNDNQKILDKIPSFNETGLITGVYHEKDNRGYLLQVTVQCLPTEDTNW